MQHLVLIDGDNQRMSRKLTPTRVRRLTPTPHTRQLVLDTRALVEGAASANSVMRSDRPRVLALHREPAIQTVAEQAKNSPLPMRDVCAPTMLNEMPRYIRNALKLHTWIVQQQWILRVAKTCW